MGKTIKLNAEIDLGKNPVETRVQPIEGDVWADLGYWLEVTGFMSYQAMKYKEWTSEQMSEYAKDYIMKCLLDYKKVK